MTRQSLAALTALSIGVCVAVSPASAQVAGAQIPNDATLRLAGSNTVGEKLAAVIGSNWARKLGFTAIRTDAGANAEEYTLLAERAEGSRRLRFEVRAHGTGTGAEPLVRGQSNLWMASRQARETDLEAVRKKNVPGVPAIGQVLAPGNEHVIALDALAVLVHPRNPLQQLSVAQIKDIFAGKIVNWSEIGGPNLPIVRYSRDSNSGTFDTFCSLVMGIGETAKCAETMGLTKDARFESSEDLSDTVSSNPAGIGFVGIGYVRAAKALSIASGCGLSAPADVFLIKADEYPLARRLYLYTMPGRAPSAEASSFLQFAASAEGQAGVSGAGFVDLLASVSSPDYVGQRLDMGGSTFDGGHIRVRPRDLHELEGAITGSERLSITFRFQAGSNQLDSRAEADIRRLADLLKTPDYAGARLTLVGFSQTQGDYQENRSLSKERADGVRDRLINEFGLKNIDSVGVGPTSPIACNNDASAARNQRVEAWVRGRR